MIIRFLVSVLMLVFVDISPIARIAAADVVQSVPAQATVPLQEPLIVDGREAEELFIQTGQGRFRFTAEIADEDVKRSRGLMFREKMQPTHGMLFDFGGSRRIQMWMRNTPLSLDMIFIDQKGNVVRIAEHTTPFSEAIVDSGEPVSFVLEINAGVSRLIGLKPGDRIEHPVFTVK